MSSRKQPSNPRISGPTRAVRGLTKSTAHVPGCRLDLASRIALMRPTVHGVTLDPETRCAHYHSRLDIIAIKMRCCETYYACRECHDTLAGHACAVWPVEEWGQAAVLCGACGAELSVRRYLDCDSTCPTCRAPFNPGCRGHHHLYFEAV
jgi:uncharacterized CHY-type Zn-finger protein